MLAGWPENCKGTPSDMAGVMNYEIVSTRLVGATACTSPDGRSARLRSGWMASKNCTCDNKASAYINCAEVQHPPYWHDLHLPIFLSLIYRQNRDQCWYCNTKVAVHSTSGKFELLFDYQISLEYKALKNVINVRTYMISDHRSILVVLQIIIVIVCGKS